jgi:RNA polymerase sigma-70 factor (ECF subfamily)
LFRFALPLDAAIEIVDTTVTGEAVIDDARALARVAKAIAALPANLKEPLILTAVDGLSQADAATVLGISEKAVEVRIYRARKALNG